MRAVCQEIEGFGAPTRAENETCWICARALGPRVEWHHPVPRSRGGRETVPVHPICHATMHRAFTNTELAAVGRDVDALRRNERIARFLLWIAGKPPQFHAPTHGRWS